MCSKGRWRLIFFVVHVCCLFLLVIFCIVGSISESNTYPMLSNITLQEPPFTLDGPSSWASCIGDLPLPHFCTRESMTSVFLLYLPYNYPPYTHHILTIYSPYTHHRPILSYHWCCLSPSLPSWEPRFGARSSLHSGRAWSRCGPCGCSSSGHGKRCSMNVMTVAQYHGLDHD